MIRREHRDGNQPADTPAAAVVAVLLSIALIAAGLVSGRELMVDRNVFHGHAWVGPAMAWIGRITWHNWMLYLSIVAIAVGLALLAVAAKPRNREHIPTAGTPTLWLRARDVARFSTAAALRVPGVTDAHSTARRRSVDVEVVAARGPEEVIDAVRAEISSALDGLAVPPRVRVSVTAR